MRGAEIAMIFQDPMTALNPVYTIGNQLLETIMLHQKVNQKEGFEIAVEALDAVRLPNARERMRDYPHQLSGGMRQRVMIAMGLSCNPKLLIADEPTTALDVTTQAQILDLMLNLADQRKTAVMLITHDLGVVAGFCDTIQVMYGGRLAERAPTASIFDSTYHPYTAGLLGSMTRLDEVREERLMSIRGAPPSLINPGAAVGSAPAVTTPRRSAAPTPRCRVRSPRAIGPPATLRRISDWSAAATRRKWDDRRQEPQGQAHRRPDPSSGHSAQGERPGETLSDHQGHLLPQACRCGAGGVRSLVHGEEGRDPWSGWRVGVRQVDDRPLRAAPPRTHLGRGALPRRDHGGTGSDLRGHRHCERQPR